MRNISIVTAMILLGSIAGFAQDDANMSMINIVDELELPFQTVLNSLESNENVNSVEYGKNRYGHSFIRTTYYDTSNTTLHMFNKNKNCVSIEYRSNNFRDYSLVIKTISDTLNEDTYYKVKGDNKRYLIELKVSRSLWIIKASRS